MNRKTRAGDRRRRKLMTTAWALGLAVLVIVLIYLEKTAILYILCTLGVTALLMIVALADLGHEEVHNSELVQANDAAGGARRSK
jgi:fatty acid desaturase